MNTVSLHKDERPYDFVENWRKCYHCKCILFNEIGNPLTLKFGRCVSCDTHYCEKDFNSCVSFQEQICENCGSYERVSSQIRDCIRRSPISETEEHRKNRFSYRDHFLH